MNRIAPLGALLALHGVITLQALAQPPVDPNDNTFRSDSPDQKVVSFVETYPGGQRSLWTLRRMHDGKYLAYNRETDTSGIGEISASEIVVTWASPDQAYAGISRVDLRTLKAKHVWSRKPATDMRTPLDSTISNIKGLEPPERNQMPRPKPDVGSAPQSPVPSSDSIGVVRDRILPPSAVITFRDTMANGGQSKWTLRKTDNGGYLALQEGLGGAFGTAKVTETEILINWMTPNGAYEGICWWDRRTLKGRHEYTKKPATLEHTSLGSTISDIRGLDPTSNPTDDRAAPVSVVQQQQRTNWLGDNGTSITHQGNGRWVSKITGGQSFELIEAARTDDYVELHEPKGGAAIRLSASGAEFKNPKTGAWLHQLKGRWTNSITDSPPSVVPSSSSSTTASPTAPAKPPAKEVPLKADDL